MGVHSGDDQICRLYYIHAIVAVIVSYKLHLSLHHACAMVVASFSLSAVTNFFKNACVWPGHQSNSLVGLSLRSAVLLTSKASLSLLTECMHVTADKVYFDFKCWPA